MAYRVEVGRDVRRERPVACERGHEVARAELERAEANG
jgi:hypothetical protein